MSDLSADVVAQRLAVMAEQTRALLDSAEGRARMRKRARRARAAAVVDMSDHAIEARIARVAALHRLCLSLGRSQPT